MGENFKPALSIADYERVSEEFVRRLGAPIPIVDELLKSHILTVDGEVVTFEHDLLKDYFRAEHLVRQTELHHLVAKLEEPRYSGLAEFVAPALSDDHVLRNLLANASVDLLTLAFRGWLGTPARRIIRDQCRRLFTECHDRISEITVEASVVKLDNGRRFISAAHVVGPSCASDLDRKLCEVVADNLGDDLVRDDFLDLLDLGEWALKEASERAARELHIKPIAIWGKLLHYNVLISHAGPVHPVLCVCHQIRENFMLVSRRSDHLPVRGVLLQRVREGKAGALALLLLMFGLRYRDSINVADVLAIVRQAWETNVEIIRMEALDFVHSNSSAICETGPEAEAAVVALLEDFDVRNNIMLSTQWLETRSSFGGFEIGINGDSALDEFRRVLEVANAGDDPLYHLERDTDPSVTFSQFIARWASATLGKVFEDVFQSAYYEAYYMLTEEEKKRLLILALQDTHVGLFTDWYMRQLCKIGCEGAQDLLRRYGSRVDPEAFSSQDCVDCFIMANEAWAKIANEPIPYREISSPDHQAWAIIGELIFWSNRQDNSESAGRISFLCDELMRFPTALPDVLVEIGSSHKGMGTAPVLNLLLTRHSSGIRKALHESLKYEGQLTSAFGHAQFYQNKRFQWTISTLGDIGDRESIILLRSWTDSTTYGKDAIHSIERIEQRETDPRKQGPNQLPADHPARVRRCF
jgi:hypothetical protein